MYDLILTEFLDKHVLAFSPKREEISDEGSPEEGDMVSAAKSITFASLISLCELNTHWMKRLGWQL